MKKSSVFISLICVCICTLNLSCSKKDDSNAVMAKSVQPVFEPEPVKTPINGELKTFNYGTDAVYAAADEDYYNLDYKVQVPEPEPVEKRISTASNAAKSGSTNGISKARELNEYKIQYNTKRKAYEEADISGEDKKAENSRKELKVIDWGPQDEILSEMSRPTFYVIFSEPVKALTALPPPSSKSDIMTITPALNGVFRWYGTNQLSFECSENADPCETYTITINDKLTSLSGDKISGEKTFTTKAQALSFKLYPGYTKLQAYNEPSDGIALDKARNMMIYVPSPLTTADFQKVVEIKNNKTGKSLDYTVETDSQTPMQKFYVTLKDKIPANTEIMVSILASKKNGETTVSHSENYYTLMPFQILSIDKQIGQSSVANKNPLRIKFNQIPDISSLENKITMQFLKKDSEEYTEPVSVSKENLKLTGKTLTVTTDDVLQYGKKGKINISADVKDIYGQKVDTALLSANFSIPDASSFFKLCDTGNRFLEAQYPHRIAYAYQNIKPVSAWTLNNIANPLANRWDLPSDVKETTTPNVLNSDIRDQQVMEGVELDPLLDDGYGWVTFCADYTYDTSRYGEKYENKDSDRLNVQVTDLGVTARLGINKAVVMVRSLSKDEPVADAEVSLYMNNLSNKNLDSLTAGKLASGKTDKNGYAVIDISDESASTIEKVSASKNSYFIVPALLVTKGKDKVTFYPNTHKWNGDLADARRVKSIAYMFTDRGIYKPGETVTFKGIDKNLHMGEYTSYHGEYQVVLQSVSWRDKKTYAIKSGTTSEHGGFSNEIVLPEDLEPYTYRLIYSRVKSGKKVDVETCYFRVEYFEPESMQTEITMPEYTLYGGDSFSSEVYGTYLAGGVIADAQVDNSWYSAPSRFTSNLPDAENFTFGPEDAYDYRKLLSDDKTTLSSDGTVNASITTAKITNGIPYKYTLESEITDISNHSTTGKKSITVYPAKFNIGLGTPTLAGFAEKGKKLTVSYVLVTPEDTLAQKSLVNGNIKCEINHITWEVSNVNGVNDDIYSSWHKVAALEKSDTITAETKGEYSFVPASSGLYSIKFSAEDNKGNTAISELEIYVTGGNWYNPDSSEKITLTPDKKQYNPGDTAKILVSSPINAGDYLITVERETIFTQEIRHFDKPVNVIEIPVASNYLPYAEVCIASYSKRTAEPDIDFGEKDLNKPKGLYGSTSIHVNILNKAFSIDVQSDKTIYKPGDTAKITFTATKNGNPVPGAAITALGVDRAVVDLINYHIPNPLYEFYSQYLFPHCVRGGDTRDMLMDPVTYAIKNLQGGDADETKEEQRKDFRSTAFFSSELITDDNGKTEVTFTVPSQLTTFRVTAVGVHDQLFGYQESEFGVRNPINVQAVQPSRLRVRDTAECGVMITNLGNEPQEVTVAVEVQDPSKEELTRNTGLVSAVGKLFIDGKSEKTVTVAGGSTSVVYFDVGAEQAGKQNLVYHVKSSVLTEALYSTVTIEKSYAYETVSLNGSTDEKSGELVALPQWSDDGKGELSVTLDASRLGLLSSAVNYVFDYPYGCFEQRSSKILPLVIFEKYLDVFDMESEISDPRSLVINEFRNFAKYQKSDGGFGYWPDSSSSNLYVSLRIAELYQTALEHSYTNDDLKINYEKLISFIKTYFSDKDNHYSDNLVAYTYYILSKNGMDCTDKADDLFAKAKGKDLDTMALCGLIYNQNNPSKCESAVKEIRKYLQDAGQGISVVKLNDNPETLAHVLKLIVLQDKTSAVGDKVLFTLLKKQTRGYWNSTRQTAAVLDAVYNYIKVRNLDNVDFNAKATLSGKLLAQGEFKGAGAKAVTVKEDFTSQKLKDLTRNKNLNLDFEKSGNGTLYYSAVMKYALPDELQNARDEGIGVTVEYTDIATDTVITTKDDSKVMELEAGKTYNVKIVITSTKNLDELALRAPVPSGASILDPHLANTSSKAKIQTTNDNSRWWTHRITNQAMYENEGQFFWDYFQTGSYTLEFKIRAARRGVYPVPPVTAECMYEPEIFGRTDGYLFVIK